MKKLILLAIILSIATSSYAAIRSAKVSKNAAPTRIQELTLGAVQKNIQVGTTQATVVKVLGSPNIVTRDAYGKDTWIYDKVSSSVSYDTDGSYKTLIFIGHHKSKANVVNVEKTLTVVIKFNQNYRVESYTYYMSQF